jgi:spore cortex formation protein SpoVR/YcgB (stage V sporulation)
MIRLFNSNEWTYDTIQRIYDAVEEIGVKELGLNLYPNQIEIVTTEQMLDSYTSVGLPVMWNHWSFGKRFAYESNLYKKGMQGLAYELVINSNPCISYCMEDNTAAMQTLVIAHAAMGHNHFFKNNGIFKEWTDADSILDYLVFAKNYINKCEERYGVEKVEATLDAAHALQNNGIFKYKRPSKLNPEEECKQQQQRENEYQKQVSDLWRTLPEFKNKVTKTTNDEEQPTENILYYLEKNSPVLETWQREILRIVRKVAQYFYPQGQTQVMNEGFASIVHYKIMNRLYEKDLIGDGTMQEFLTSHTSVLYQRSSFQKGGGSINPYALGFDIMSDIERICSNPTDEDREWFPHLIGENGWEVIKDAVENYRDSSFILQYLSPTVIRKWRMITVTDQRDHYLVEKIHDQRGYKNIRSWLSKSYENRGTEVLVQPLNRRKTMTLELIRNDTPYQQFNTDSVDKMLQYMKFLWGYPVILMHYNQNGALLKRYDI